MLTIKVKVKSVRGLTATLSRNAHNLGMVGRGLTAMRMNVHPAIRLQRNIVSRFKDATRSLEKVESQVRALNQLLNMSMDRYSSVLAAAKVGALAGAAVDTAIPGPGTVVGAAVSVADNYFISKAINAPIYVDKSALDIAKDKICDGVKWGLAKAKNWFTGLKVTIGAFGFG